ncbi:hypothetical protein CPB97_003165, partial [Podila verticillata]
MSTESTEREKAAVTFAVSLKMGMAQKKPSTRKLAGTGGTSPPLGVNTSKPASGITKQAKVSASASTRPRPPISHETPVGAFPVAGVNIVDKKEPSTPSEITPSPITTTSKTVQSHMGGSGLSPGARPTSNGHSTPPQPLRFSFSMSPPAAAAEWKPTLSLDAISPGFSSSTLKTREFFPQPELHPYFFLESNYMIRASLPRSFYIIMAQHGIRHCCVFDFPVGNKWWSELSGMRKSTYIDIRAENSSVRWELHLKPSRDRSNVFGYICQHDDLVKLISAQKFNLLKSRRLPLVLDLDDTLVRLVGNERTRYVSETDAATVPHRVRRLRDGRQVVLTEYVEEFLEWACKLYEISVCSLGEQSYVDQVADVLDPMRTRIRGTRYSARQEYDFLNGGPTPQQPNDANGASTPANGTTGAYNAVNNNVANLSTAAITQAIVSGDKPPTPPKDLLSLYAFCAVSTMPTDGLPDIGTSFALPLILDDLTQMWPPEQHDNVIVVKEQKNAQVWTVNLFPVVHHVLGNIHQEFFRAYDTWERARNLAVASITIPTNNVNVNGSNTNDVAMEGTNSLSAIDFTLTTPAKTAFLSMPIPSAIGCYKDVLRATLRDQIGVHAQLPPPALTAS